MTTTGKYIIYGLTNWIDLKCKDNLVCIDYCSIDNNKPAEYIKKYSMPYNRPKLKFVILCDTEEECEYIQRILCCELEEYETDNCNWFNNFDTEYLKNYKILVGNNLKIFEED
jgi:hypothetical protein